MIFSEIYSAYYNVMAKVLRAAVSYPLEKGALYEIIQEHAFGESILNIQKAIREEHWQLMKADGTTPIQHPPTLPLTNLQKRWLKAISLDPRMKLFDVTFPDLDDVEPLFTPDDYDVFDKYSDGDPYEDKLYVSHFKLILSALKAQHPLEITMRARNGQEICFAMQPDHLEYSEKDDKFRLIGISEKYADTVNLSRILSCRFCGREFIPERRQRMGDGRRTAELELTDERNALERVLLHFAHFEKQAEKLDEKKYKVRITYEKEDETEILIRVLSFGPMVKVTGPEPFIELIKERLINQIRCEL